ncbi:1-acyl-sn-glycerol-3-phosphate acyltransferase [Persicobacter sp. CCB-QB2]|uniref:1-acyl-sn-glycerol-3-phosphate acyltransferase n=1 Tax=Persicobacter sp. CCB-QB2 TaxID=1561025 RepID=UPI0006A9722A|nr:1-acyl-sn-glycerol-3-phosphate acyltransferase [Persicobacter sp. CCB-QB2]
MKEKAKSPDNSNYQPIEGDLSRWPVVKMARNRKAFVKAVADESLERLLENRRSSAALIEELETTVFKERLRIKQNPWDVDPEDDRKFWNSLRSELGALSHKQSSEEEKMGQLRVMVHKVVSRYAEEIAGNFKPSHYRLARTVVTFGLTRLLNAAKLHKFTGIFKNDYTLDEKIKIKGAGDKIRALAKKGTIILVPTHFSNLDSVLLGYVIHRLGLPPFIYGAGLNLFNIKIFAYFMDSLGAYKVDRRKKNQIYLEALKTYSSKAIREGAHSLFFPGGTRSRSGKMEKKLKLGLLSTAIEAQRYNFTSTDENKDRKIYVVPLVINYNFVLEAPELIDQYLKLKGQERYYVENDEYSDSYKILKFLIKFFTRGSSIAVSLGEPMDVVGNLVNEKGESLDSRNKVVDVRDYFVKNGEINIDHQREHQYTRMLGDKISKAYYDINCVQGSNLSAFIAYQMLKKKHSRIDFFNLLRLPEEELIIDYEAFKQNFAKLLETIKAMQKQGKIEVADHLLREDLDLDKMIASGIRNVGMYHSKQALYIAKDQQRIQSEDMNLLFYYHNRLDGYHLDEHITI